jgi:hypothetical protein
MQRRMRLVVMLVVALSCGATRAQMEALASARCRQSRSEARLMTARRYHACSAARFQVPSSDPDAIN